MKLVKSSFKLLSIISLVGLSFMSCDDSNDDQPKAATTLGNLNIIFDNVVGDKDLVLTTKDVDGNILNSETYTNASNENYQVEELKYIISNIVLIGENGEKFEYPRAASYFVIDEADKPSLTVSLENVPSGEYDSIKFGVGVEPSRYTDGTNGTPVGLNKQPKDFIPKAEEKDMLWGWAAGFKFLKFEGTFGDDSQVFRYHIGSLGAKQDNYKETTIKLSNSIVVSEKVVATVRLKSDIDKIFNSKKVVSIATKPDIQVDNVNSPILADNTISMFTNM